MNEDLTKGPVMKSMLCFAVPMILGNLLQQCYNVADTLIVGQFIGSDALAAVGSAFTLMAFDEGIPCCDLLWDTSCFSLQLFCVLASVSGKFCCAAGFPWSIGCLKYCFGPLVCNRAETGSGRCGRGNGYCPVYIRGRADGLLLAAFS